MKDQIEEILENFDFDKVHQVMTFLNWTWFRIEAVPNHYQLIKEARRLLEEISTSENSAVKSLGGFEVRNEDGNLSLSFVVSKWYPDV